MSRPTTKPNLIKRLEEEKLSLEANEYVTRHGYVRKIVTRTVNQYGEERTLKIEKVVNKFDEFDDLSDIFDYLEKHF